MVRKFRDAAGTEWVVFLTTRSASGIGRDHHLPEAYLEGWLLFESTAGDKRRLAPVPPDWDALSEAGLRALCDRATPQSARRGAARPYAGEEAPRTPAVTLEPAALRPKLEEAQEKLDQALEEVCEAPPPDKLDTGELIRVEEALALATEAAKEAVSLRRKLRATREREIPNEVRAGTPSQDL